MIQRSLVFAVIGGVVALFRAAPSIAAAPPQKPVLTGRRAVETASGVVAPLVIVFAPICPNMFALGREAALPA